MKLRFLGTSLAVGLATLAFGTPAQAQYAPAPPPEQAPQQPPPPPQYPQQPQQGYPQQPQHGYPPPPPQGYQQQPYGYQPQPGMSPYAQPMQGTPPGYHKHDGFYFRGTLGLGGGSSKSEASNPADDLEFSGFAGALHLAFGGAVTENLILYAELGGFSIPGPDVKEGQQEAGKAPDDFSVGTGGFGGGLAYYFMPINVYASASLMFTRLTLSYDNKAVKETDLGVGASLKVGKEWWVSQDWGLGAFVGFERAVMKDKTQTGEIGDPPVWTTTGFTVGFSATYN